MSELTSVVDTGGPGCCNILEKPCRCSGLRECDCDVMEEQMRFESSNWKESIEDNWRR